MKKALAVFTFLITITSCSVEDDTTPKTTSVVISTGNEFASSTTGNNVQRGSLFAWISEIQVKATHQSGYISTTDFTLVDNGTSGAETQFLMDDVQIGNNTFTASTKTSEPERLETTQVLKTEDLETTMSNLNIRNPYAVYSSTTPVNFNIISGEAQNVTIPLKTDNSRFIAIFDIDDSSQHTRSYKISCYVNDVPFGPPATCNRNYNATFYWSDSASTAGKSIYFKIVHGNDTYTTDAKVLIASNTTKMRYTISNDTLVTTPM